MSEKEKILSCYSEVKLIESVDRSSGSWIETTKEIYIARKNSDGEWYRLEICEIDNPYKGPPTATLSEQKL